MTAVRRTAAVAAALSALALTGCGTAASPATSSAAATDAGPTVSRTLAVQSEDEGCAGDVTVRATTDWTLQKDHLVRADGSGVDAYCDDRSRYEKNEPGLTWDLDSMVHLVYPKLNSATHRLTHLEVDGVQAQLLETSSDNGVYDTLMAIVGDEFVTVEVVTTPQRDASSAARAADERLLRSVRWNVRASES